MPNDILQSTTQKFLDIHDITNNLLLMKDGSAAIIISVDAMNFGLLAEEEQDAVMYAYAGLLNSLNYPIQIIVRSQTKDVTSYLRLLEDQENNITSEIMRKRIKMYREFVGNLIHERNVLDKKFYVAVPASSVELGLLAPSGVVPGKQSFDISTVEKSIIVEKATNILEPKRDHLVSQFARIGLFSQQLNTQEIIQLFYISYNPEASEGQNITDSNSYTTPLVQPSIISDLPSQSSTSPVEAEPVDPQETTLPVTVPTEPAADPIQGTTPEVASVDQQVSEMPPMVNEHETPPVEPVQPTPTETLVVETTPAPPPIMKQAPPAQPIPDMTPPQTQSIQNEGVVFDTSQQKQNDNTPLPPLPEI